MQEEYKKDIKQLLKLLKTLHWWCNKVLYFYEEWQKIELQ